MSGVSIACGAGMSLLRSVVVCFVELCVSYPNENEVTVYLGSDKRAIMSLIY